MSDYFGKDPGKAKGRPEDVNPWQQDPFAAYDDPAINPAGTGAPLPDADDEDASFAPKSPAVPDYSAWRRPDTTRADAGMRREPEPTTPASAFGANPPSFSAPESFGVVDAGAETGSQGAGRVPFSPYGARTEDDFATLGADAPTRIARPIGSQLVNKHKTIGRPQSAFQPDMPMQAPPVQEDTAAPQSESGTPRRRRTSRAARHEEVANQLQDSAPRGFSPEAPPAASIAMPQNTADVSPSRRGTVPQHTLPPEGRERIHPTFDPFEAGDSETAQPDSLEEQTAGETPRPSRRPAMPGGRYTGARTALPQSGARRSLAPYADAADADNVDTDAQRQAGYDAAESTHAPQRPQGAPGQGQRPPVRLDANGRPIPPQRPQGAPGQGQRPPVRLDADGRPIPQQRPQGAPGQGQRPPVRLDADGRPIPPQRPQGAPGQGQRPPVRLDANGRPIPQQRPQGMAQARPPRDDAYAGSEANGLDPRRQMRAEEETEQPLRFDPRRGYPEMQPRASVERPPYDFEDELDEAEPPRRGGVLIPLVIVLLVLGGLLAGIILPDWDASDSGLNTAMSKIKSAVVSVFDGVKSLISPAEEGVKSITVSPTTGVAPVELVFNVQASTAVTDIRIVDESGVEILAKTLTDSGMLGGEVTRNSLNNIWTLRYACQDGYEGTFTAQAMKKDGTWEDGVTIDMPVSIQPPAVADPPVQDFTVDTKGGTTPAAIGFTVVTSKDVTAVQIVNDYGMVITEAYLGDMDALVDEDAYTRSWSLSALVTDPYTGSFYAGYQTDQDLTFTQSDYDVDVTLTAETDVSRNTSLSMMDSSEDDAFIGGDGGDGSDDEDMPSDITGDASMDDAAQETAVAQATLAPAAIAQAEPTAEPVAQETPKPTPLPLLTAAADESADPQAIKLTTVAYEGTTKKTTYERANKIVLNDPSLYAVWEQSGILTFRGDSLRQNAAYGTVNLTSKALTEIWKVPMEGSISGKSSTLTGVSWPGQPLIIKWPTQLRAILALNDEAKNKQALKETIVGGQNGKIYFLDLVTGEATREAITMDWPSNGVLSLQTNASPILAVGQHLSVLAKKTVDNGLHFFNLLNDKELTMLKGKEKLMRSNYSGVNGAPLFDKNTGAMIVGGQNGILYTMEPNDTFDHVLATLKIDPAYQRYTWLASKQKEKSTNIDAAIAMYGSYAYFGDQTGIVQCVDVNTLTAVWAVDTGDNVDATIALEMENDTTVSLYTGNTILNQGRSGVCTIRKLDALTGKELWAFEVPDLTYTTEASVGVLASPVVGQNKVSDTVYFTVTNGKRAATLYALSKSTGSIKWSLPLASPSVSSPVAVYSDAGDAWIVQGESDGTLRLIDAKTGTVLSTMQLEGSIESSPAVYRDVLVIATTGKDKSYIYGIKLN